MRRTDATVWQGSFGFPPTDRAASKSLNRLGWAIVHGDSRISGAVSLTFFILEPDFSWFDYRVNSGF